MKNRIILTAALLLALPCVALADDGFWGEVASDIVPLTAIVSAIVVPFVVLLAVLIAVMIYNYRKSQMRARIIEKSLESGRDLPDGFWPPKKKRNPLKDEITYLGIGLGFLFMGCVSDEFMFTGVAIIFLVMSVGGFLVYCLHRPAKTSDKDDSDDEKQ